MGHQPVFDYFFLCKLRPSLQQFICVSVELLQEPGLHIYSQAFFNWPTSVISPKKKNQSLLKLAYFTFWCVQSPEEAERSFPTVISCTQASTSAYEIHTWTYGSVILSGSGPSHCAKNHVVVHQHLTDNLHEATRACSSVSSHCHVVPPGQKNFCKATCSAESSAVEFHQPVLLIMCFYFLWDSILLAGSLHHIKPG